MSHRLFKDIAVADSHVTTALGNERKTKRKARSFLSIISSKGDETKFKASARLIKVDEKHGLVLGFAVVCTCDGAPYFDLQGDYIPEDAMLAAAVDFMQHSRMAKEMHKGEEAGTIVFAMPLTADIAKAFSIETKTTGLMIAMKPGSAEMLRKFCDGTYTGFSIGGQLIADEEIIP